MNANDLLTRRRAIATIGAAAGTLLLSRRSGSALPTLTMEIARGRVIDATKGNQKSANGARGIAGVMVSTGRDVVVTDDAGSWSLPVQHGDHVFVINPSGWVPAAAGHAAFSYLHQPDGTPRGGQLRGPALEPTGAMPASIDFALKRQPQPKTFEVLLFADTQAVNAKELGYARHVLLEATKNSTAAFAIHHGDAMADDLTLLPAYMRILAETGLAWHHCPGNHDINLDSPDAQHAFEAWKRYVGPPAYAFQYGGATFILLNNVEYFGAGRTGADGRGYRGRIGDDQLHFVAKVLGNVDRDDLVVVSMHVPLASFDNPDGPADTTSDAASLLRLVSGSSLSLSFSGHSHTTEHHDLGTEHGYIGPGVHHHQVLTAACGSWWSGPCDASGIPIADSRDGTPKGFHVLRVEGSHASTRFVPFGQVADRDMRVLVQRRDGEPSVVVDVFDGGPLTRVTCEIEGRPATAIELERANIADPYIVEAFAGYQGNCKPWVAPARSSHVWTSVLPASFAVDRLLVRATDERFAPIIDHATLS